MGNPPEVRPITNEAFREIFQSMSEGIIMVDTTGKVVVANPVAEQLFGFSMDQMTGLMLEDLLPERYRKGHLNFRPKESFFAEQAGVRVVAGGTLIGLLTIFGFFFGHYQHGYTPFDSEVPEYVTHYARTMAFMTIISCQLLYSLTFRNNIKSIFQVGIFSNRYLIGAIALGSILQLVVLAVPVMREAFKLQMLDVKGWITVIILGLIPLVVNEIVKAATRHSRRIRTV